MNFERGLYSDQVLTADGFQEAIVTFSEGKINAILDPEDKPELLGDIRIVDYQGFAILPGLIDTHVHVNEPGRTHWEGFETATKAAISGGITTLIDMPLNCDPVTTSVDNLNTKKSAMTDQLYCQVGFHGGIVPESVQHIRDLKEEGVYAFKIFMTHSGIDEFPMIPVEQLQDIMTELQRIDSILMVHAELGEDIAVDGDPKDYQTYLQSRPREWENNAIRILIDLMKETGCRVHIIHLSSSDALPMIREAKDRGLPLTVETCPHYLYFTAEEIGKGQTTFKCAPPIRERENREKLWRAIEEGIIDFVASDHSPSPPELKSLETGDFMTAWGGISSLQFGLSTIWTQAQLREISLETVIRLMSTKPANFLGLEDKGEIAVGKDADIIVFDPSTSYEVIPVTILHKHKITPYGGRRLLGEVVCSYISGVEVYNKPKNMFKVIEKPMI